MNRLLSLGLLALVVLPASVRAQEVTGLSGWSLFLDPGHSGTTENVGIYGYSEPEKVLRVGLALREMLLTRTDIDTVYMSRTNDSQSVDLSQRTDLANSLGADFFHSIHSNAGGPSTNYLFILWPQLVSGEEPAPPYAGGRALAELAGPTVSGAMRIESRGTNGAFGECDFYGVSSCRTTTPKGSRNFVQSFSLMPSMLSEAGFHTSPVQNPRNMNAEWKRLEAQAFYWAILDWHGVPRSTHRIATGFVTDVESGRPINGAAVEIDGQTYTTDTYESLFHRYSDAPEELANGFYYLEDLGPGTHTVAVSAPGYEAATTSVTMLETEFSFADVALVSVVPPVVVDSDPEAADPNFPVTGPLRLTFSRPLVAATVEGALSLVPTAGGEPVAGTVTLEDGGYRLMFTPDASLEARTDYTLTLAGTAATANGSLLDGDGDGTGGDDFVLAFTSSFPDTEAPRLAQSYPRVNATEVEHRPVVTVAFSEPLDAATLDGRVTLEVNETGAAVPGRFEHVLAGVVGEDPEPRSTVSFVPEADLAPGIRYRFAIEPGVADRFGNASTSRYGFTFVTGSASPVVTVLDAFEGTSVADNWWVPAQSGSTIGTVADSTGAAASDRASLLGGTTSMRIDYGWDAGADAWLIRQYLGGGPPLAVSFDDSYTLQAAVFGDGNGTLFRFAVDDASSTEVSPWFAVDWYGWRPVSWDLGAGETGSWIGNGVLEGTLRFDSIQLGYDGVSPRFGEIYVDDLRLLRSEGVASEGDPEAAGLSVALARPNPFRDRTEIGFTLGAPAEVTVRVFNVLGQEVARLAENAPYRAGTHALTWAADGLAAGAYVARVEVGGESRTIRMVLAR